MGFHSGSHWMPSTSSSGQATGGAPLCTMPLQYRRARSRGDFNISYLRNTTILMNVQSTSPAASMTQQARPPPSATLRMVLQSRLHAAPPHSDKHCAPVCIHKLNPTRNPLPPPMPHFSPLSHSIGLGFDFVKHVPKCERFRVSGNC